MNKLKRFWSNLRSSFWFMPSLIVVFSIALAVVLIEADSAGSDRWLAQWPRLFGAGAEGARGMMSTIAGSMMTVVGVTFSMILVVLALASSQYTSRNLRNIAESLENLNRTFHRLRQSGIDEELFDVISGFEAMRVKEK